MKKYIDNKLYVQGIDIKILLKYDDMSDDVRTQMSQIDWHNRDYDFIEIYDGIVKDYLVASPYIIDYDEYNNMSVDQILNNQVKINNEITYIYNIFTNGIDRDEKSYNKLFKTYKLYTHQLFLIDLMVYEKENSNKKDKTTATVIAKPKKRIRSLFSFTK